MVKCAQSVVLNECACVSQFVITKYLSAFIVYVRGRNTLNSLQTCWRYLSGDGKHQRGLMIFFCFFLQNLNFIFLVFFYYKIANSKSVYAEYIETG